VKHNHPTKMKSRRVVTIVVASALIVCGAVAYILFATLKDTEQQPSLNSAPSLIDQSTLESLPNKDDSPLYLERLDDGMTPPTNKWFSGLALQETPQAVFPLPLSFLPTDTGYTVGLPSPVTTEDSIVAPHVPSVRVDIDNATSYQVSRYDELTVDLTYYDAGGKPLMTVTVASGIPYVSTVSKQSGVSIKYSSIEGNFEQNGSSSAITVDAESTVYGIVTTSNKQLSPQGKTILEKDQALSVFAAPKGSEAKVIDLARHRVMGGTVSYVRRDEYYDTTLQYEVDGGSTMYAAMPHQSIEGSPLFSYDSIYGSLDVYSGSEFTYESERISVTPRLDLSALSNDQKTALIDQLQKDVESTEFSASDTYFGGKAVYRAAQLLELAKQLEADAIADNIQKKLTDELTDWLSDDGADDEKAFVYVASAQGLVGKEASFGSDEFNDHHFHYGYFIYAAAILAQYDADFLSAHKDGINLLVADIANYKTGEELPLRRAYDPYAGHSWASGAAPFSDGNNQESSSEAINAWTGVALWGEVSGNDALEMQAGWLLSNEALTAQRYWLTSPEGSGFDGYEHEIVSLNWGAKRDYATWFSDRPSAILGIQLLPLNPTQRSLLASIPDKAIKAQAEEALSSTGDRPLGDYVLMYRSLSDNTDDEGLLRIEDSQIDDGNSRSYLMAWLFAD